ncbi:arylsulfatase [Penicillium diatomitis]|uniref:Arylsulfatase n=1 Tax=Penicillium diatomitis TaxID=2819901 RepID=A0A9X0C299_9EURO|nr:arylsulfatase [Penicillium diatomitis]KAJ5494935.1 arylsulfatase [Penicillium diatomitis]
MSSSHLRRPNFLVIVADDLGFSDSGPYGSEIKTPNLDRLAASGIRLTDFHTAPSCSPTRSMLFSGTDNHIAGLGQMAEHMASFEEEVFKDRPGYEGYLNFRVAALSEILQDADYHTMMAGKWHLGMNAKTSPSARGFDRVATLLPGAGNHFNFEPQLDQGIKPPAFLASEGFWMEDDRFLDRKTELPDNFYSSNYFTDKLLTFMHERPQDKPFFAYLAFTAPHWPLQAPKAVSDKYKGWYDDGPEALRQRRLQSLKDLGLIPKDAKPAPMNTPLAKDWASLSPEERMISSRKMEVYAAMVEVMDENIGRVIDELESTGELDNTFIVFMSDNGAEGTLLEATPMASGTPLMEMIAKFYDNSLENIGQHDSYVWYGPHWALAATAPSRAFKGFTTEGGIRCPCIVRYPVLDRCKDKDLISHEFTTVMDILPTFLDLAHVPHPGNTFRGRDVVPVRGRSWVPYLTGATSEVYDKSIDVTGWELFGLRGIRRGNFKAVLIPPPRGSGKWELYDLSSDPGETVDLSSKEPAIMTQMLADWDRYFAETGMFEIEYSKKKKLPKVTGA